MLELWESRAREYSDDYNENNNDRDDAEEDKNNNENAAADDDNYLNDSNRTCNVDNDGMIIIIKIKIAMVISMIIITMIIL